MNTTYRVPFPCSKPQARRQEREQTQTKLNPT